MNPRRPYPWFLVVVPLALLLVLGKYVLFGPQQELQPPSKFTIQPRSAPVKSHQPYPSDVDSLVILSREEFLWRWRGTDLEADSIGAVKGLDDPACVNFDNLAVRDYTTRTHLMGYCDCRSKALPIHDTMTEELILTLPLSKENAWRFVEVSLFFEHPPSGRKPDYKKAERWLNRAVYVDSRNPELDIRLGRLYEQMGRIEDAYRAFSWVVEQYPEWCREYDETEGGIFAKQKALKRAHEFEQWKNLRQPTGEESSITPEVLVLRRQADVLLKNGIQAFEHEKLGEALTYWEAAVTEYQRIPYSDSEQAGCYMNMGIALRFLANYEMAAVMYERALRMLERKPETDHERATCRINLGLALVDLGLYEEALSKLRKEMTVLNGLVNTEESRASCQLNIGAILTESARYEEAILEIQSALALCGDLQCLSRLRAKCHANIGATLSKMTLYNEAIAEFETAFQAFRHLEGAERDSMFLLTLSGDLLKKRGQLIQALDRYREARKHGIGVQLCTGLASVLEARGSGPDIAEACQELLVALAICEWERGKQHGLEPKLAASHASNYAYNLLARFLVNRSHERWELKESELIQWATAAEPKLRCLEAALHFADAGKARTLIELIQQRPVDVGEDAAGKKLLDGDRQLLAQIGKAHEQRETARQKDAQNTVKELEAKIDGWQQRRRQIEYELKKTYVGKFTVPEYQKASEIQSGLPEGLAILEYAVTEEDSWLIVLTRNSITAYDIPVRAEVPWDIPSKYKGQWKQDALAALAGRYATDGLKIGLEGLVRLYRAPMDTAKTAADAEKTLPETMVSLGLELGRLLLPGPMRKLLMSEEITHLVVIPDGQLHALPFAALPTGSRGSVEPKSLADCRFLIEDYRISYLPSWAMLGAIRSATKERKAEGKQKEFLALADPVFGKEDPRMDKPLPPDQVKPLEVAAVLRGIYSRYGSDRLPESSVEARQSGAVFGRVSVVERPGIAPVEDAEAVVYVGPAATAKVLEHADQYRRLLLATHGLADPRNAWLSCVVLSPDASQGYETPAYLKAADIIGLKLNADLVTLSACETGLGRLQSGEGVIGLSSAFFVAGARSLALTLWKVPSGATAEITVRFHQQLKAEPNKAEALRKAQLDFLANHPDKRHPFHWAAFVLTGDWQ